MWNVDFSNRADKFIKKNSITETYILHIIRKFILKVKGEDVNIDSKKMKGKWAEYYRIREGKIRILIAVDFDKKYIFVDVIDFRGDVYK